MREKIENKLDFIQKIRNFVFFNITDKFKRERMRLFFQIMKIKGNEIILDIGAGGGELWNKFSSFENLNLIGLDIKQNNSKVYKKFIIGDARNLPFSNKSIDIIFSNSVLEHVGGGEQQKIMANEIMRVGKKFFIQVPNKHFPVEPHYFIPFLQYLPIRCQKIITKIFFRESEEIYLPTRKQLEILFPDAEIIPEVFLGLTKSFYIYKK